MNEVGLGRWKILGAAAIGLFAAFIVLNYDRLHVYGTYIRETSPEIATRLTELSVEMNEAAIRRHFAGVGLRCLAPSPGSENLGDRLCYAAIDAADGDAALTLAVSFRRGKLTHAFVQVPWWVHESWMNRLEARYGQPRHAGLVSPFGGPVLRWSMPNGFVEFNRDRSLNPLAWNMIFWTGEKR